MEGGVGMDGRSQHDRCDRLLFSTSNFVIGFTGIAIPGTQVLFTTGFKQQVVPFQIATVVLAFYNILNDQIVGFLQDYSFLSGCFLPARWGRRAPWLLVAMPPMAVLSILALNPPNEDILLGWYVGVMAAFLWVQTTIALAYGCAFPEIYPFKAERVESQLFAIVFILVGVIFAAGTVGYVLITAQTVPACSACISYTLDGIQAYKWDAAFRGAATKATVAANVVNQNCSASLCSAATAGVLWMCGDVDSGACPISDSVDLDGQCAYDLADASDTTVLKLKGETCFQSSAPITQFQRSSRQRIIVGIVGFALVLGVGLLSVRPTRFARQPADPTLLRAGVCGRIAAFRDLLVSDSVFWYTLLLAFGRLGGSVEASMVFQSIYYVHLLPPEEAVVWLAALPLVALGLESCLAVFWSRFLRNRGRHPGWWLGVTRITPILWEPIIWWYANTRSAGVSAFAVAYILRRAMKSPRTFAERTLKDWTIDEDSHKMKGRRREALFIGFWVSVSNFAALGGTAVVLGAGLTGLDTSLPDEAEQPESATLYIRAVMAFFCPILAVCEGLSALRFPIKGERLEGLEDSQGKAFKRVELVELQSRSPTKHERVEANSASGSAPQADSSATSTISTADELTPFSSISLSV